MSKTVAGSLALVALTVATAAGRQSRPPAGDAVRDEVVRVAGLAGEPQTVSGGGVTRAGTTLLTIENPAPFEAGSPKRIVLVGGLDGDVRGARAVLSAVRWFKTAAPSSARQAWTVSALPLAAPDPDPQRGALHFPPEKGFFDGPDQSAYVWRWVAFQAPDLVVEVRGGDAIDWQGHATPQLNAVELPEGGLAAAFADANASGLGSVPGLVVTAAPTDGPRLMEDILKAARGLGRSPLHTAMIARVQRSPLDIAALMARKYPGTPAISYIPSVAWTNTLRLASLTGDQALVAKVHQQTEAWTSGRTPLFGDRIALTSVAGTMIFADLAARDNDSAARALAVEGANLALQSKADAVAQYGQGWTDDMFMSAAILARTGRMPGRQQDLDEAAGRLVAYAGRLQRPDGIFVHATDGPHAWGRGNGFAALGLIEVLAALPETHPARSRVLDIYRRQMSGLKAAQAPDGMWREVVDQPGSYREETVTAMALAAMARGIGLGWLDKTYLPVVTRAWRALTAHVAPDGALIDVCTNTGAGPTLQYYLDRPAVTGSDDRGGAMALLAAMEIQEIPRTSP